MSLLNIDLYILELANLMVELLEEVRGVLDW